MSEAAPIRYAPIRPRSPFEFLGADWREILLRLPIVLIFAIAGWGKMSDEKGITHFVTEIRAYQMVPDQISNVMAYSLASIELVCAALLLVGVWRREVRWLLLVMLIVFTVAKSIAFAQGRIVECGCVPTDSFLYPLFNKHTGLWTNVVLIGFLIGGLWIDARFRRGLRGNAVVTPTPRASGATQ